MNEGKDKTARVYWVKLKIAPLQNGANFFKEAQGPGGD